MDNFVPFLIWFKMLNFSSIHCVLFNFVTYSLYLVFSLCMLKILCVHTCVCKILQRCQSLSKAPFLFHWTKRWLLLHLFMCCIICIDLYIWDHPCIPKQSHLKHGQWSFRSVEFNLLVFYGDLHPCSSRRLDYNFFIVLLYLYLLLLLKECNPCKVNLENFSVSYIL